jgi:hypothetical protein
VECTPKVRHEIKGPFQRTTTTPLTSCLTPRVRSSRPRPCASIPKRHQGSSSIYFCFGIVNRGPCYISDVTSTRKPSSENLFCGLVCLIFLFL